MSFADSPVYIASRGSALALAQSEMVLAQLQSDFPQYKFEIKIIKTTGDKLQTLSLANPDQQLTKGLFTKELEVALLNGEADLAVHSLKDLPTELPDGLVLGAVCKRADVRDVLIYRESAAQGESAPEGVKKGRGFSPGTSVADLPTGSAIGTSSVRRQAQLLAQRPDLCLIPIRGNVGTRLQKLVNQPELDALVLAAAGLSRLQMEIDREGRLQGHEVPEGLLAVYMPADQMLPCVGQGALGIEVRAGDARAKEFCDHLNDLPTELCVRAERAFLQAMGGGCLSPVAAYAELAAEEIWLRAISFRSGTKRSGEGRAAKHDAEQLGRQLAAELAV